MQHGGLGGWQVHVCWLITVRYVNSCKCIEERPAKCTVHECHFATYYAIKKPCVMDDICTRVGRVCRVSDKCSHTGR